MKRRFAVVLPLALALLLGLAAPAGAAPGDEVCLTNRGGQEVCGIEVEHDEAGVFIDTTGDGRWDLGDTDGDGVADRLQGYVEDAATVTECAPIDFSCKAAQAINDGFLQLANYTVEALGDTTASLATFWLEVPEPDLGTMNGGPNGGTTFQPAPAVAFVESRVEWLVLALAVLSVLLGAGKLAWERRAAAGRDLVRSLITLILVAGAGLAGVVTLLEFTNGFSLWIIEESTEDFGASLVALLALDDADTAVLAVLLVILLGLIALIASIVQIALLVVRNGYLVVLAGTWSLSASATNTEVGRAAFQRQTSWLLAFILYKPAASIIYAVAFQMVDGAGVATDPVGQSITGFTLMVTALVALPALMRLVAPAVGAATGSGAGAGMLAAGIAAAPAGAAIMRSNRTGGGSAGGAATGGSGPRGGGSGGRSSGGPGGSPSGAGNVGGQSLSAGGRSGGGPAGAGAGAPTGGGGTAVLTRGAHVTQVLGTAANNSSTDDDDKGGPRGNR